MKKLKINWTNPKPCCDKSELTIHTENGDACALAPGNEVNCPACWGHGVVVEINNKLTNNQCGICADCVPQINGGSGFTNCADAHAAETAGDKMQFTKEQLIKWAKDSLMLAQCTVAARPDDVAATKYKALFEIALAALTAAELPPEGTGAAGRSMDASYRRQGARAGWVACLESILGALIK